MTERVLYPKRKRKPTVAPIFEHDSPEPEDGRLLAEPVPEPPKRRRRRRTRAEILAEAAERDAALEHAKEVEDMGAKPHGPATPAAPFPPADPSPDGGDSG